MSVLIPNARLAANRANAQSPAATVTEYGKAIAHEKVLKVGLTGPFLPLGGEDRDNFERLHESLRAEYQPVTDTESILVHNLAKHHWLMNRSLSAQKLCFEEGGFIRDEKQFALLLRLQATNENSFLRNLNQLLKLKKEREAREVGFVSQNRKIGSIIRKVEADEIKLKLLRAKLEALSKPVSAIRRRSATEFSISPGREIAAVPEKVVEKRQSASAQIYDFALAALRKSATTS